MKKISVIDYGCGNLASVINMIQHVGGEAHIIKSPAQLTEASKLVLPGVGAFDHSMNNLRDGGWVAPLEQAVFERRVPLMGICLGMQLLTHSSEEGHTPGLGWIDAHVRRFRAAQAGLKVPHMGWSEVLQMRPDHLFSASDAKPRFYFVHSYRVECNDPQDVLLQCEYGETFVAGFHRGNIWGFQFHPEKSHRFGMVLFRNFLEI